ncbi:MAG TPA: hypothetical protein DDW65_02900 [Firmicutes bacterium]|jgi:ABC-type glycerol-3-phosphate transport system permease component|nr:hypothetical protein [Bacillota bacterium]
MAASIGETASPHYKIGIEWLKHLTIIILLALSLLTIIVAIFVAGKDVFQYQNNQYNLAFPYHWENYQDAFKYLFPFVWNSVLAVATTTLLSLLLGSWCGFVFARMRFKFRSPLYYLIIALLMIPSPLSFVPQYLWIKQLGMINTPLAVIIPWTAFWQVLGVLWMRTTLEDQEEAMFEAARIDGASVWKQFWYISLPLARPVLFTLGVWIISGSWNDYVWPSIAITEPSKIMLSVALRGYMNQATTAAGMSGNLGPSYAGALIASLPLFVVVLFVGKQFVEGLVSGSVKL